MGNRDPERADRWAARAAEWRRLSDISVDGHVADLCARNARAAMDMARYWGGPCA